MVGEIPAAIAIKSKQNVVLDRDSNLHFICVGEIGEQWLRNFERSIGNNVDLFLWSGAVDSETVYIYWGKYRIQGVAKDRRTLGLFSFLQDEMAKFDNGEEQQLKGVICLSKPEFEFTSGMTYRDQIRIDLQVDAPRFVAQYLDKAGLSFEAQPIFRKQ